MSIIEFFFLSDTNPWIRLVEQQQQNKIPASWNILLGSGGKLVGSNCEQLA